MFTLKLYRNGPLPPDGRAIILETVGLWVDSCHDGVKHVRSFKKIVGVMDEDGTPEFFVGGNPAEPIKSRDDYYSWGVLENSQGKTTEIIK